MSQIRIGEKLGSFRLDSIVGSGAMGVVYRGINDSTGKPAAIKVVSGEISQRGKVYERFMREAEILKQFRHPNIVRFLAVGRFQGTSYIAMEFIQGETLDKTLEQREALPWREVVDLAIQMCDALHYAHEHGVVHRDLKPSNLMVTEDGRIKLTDFGIAKDLDATALTATGRTLGTAAYMAPEQIRGAPAVSHKTDLYALGIVLYQLLVGKTPFEGSSPMILMHNHLNEKPPRASAKVAEIPVALDDLVVSLMAKEPADRPWDAAAVAHKLSELKKKSEKGKSVKMVWSDDVGNAKNPLRLGTGTATKPESDRQSRNRGGKTSTGWSFSAEGAASVLFSRAGLEIAGLVSLLVAIGGFMVYLVWPPGQEYLYQHAKPLMASAKRADWLTARDEYFDPLDRRFPAHPYRDETTGWRDRIYLDEAEGRARVLTSPIKISLNIPKTDAERQYVITHEVAAQASQRHDDLEAMHQWQSVAGHFKPDDPTERGWHLLAQKHAADLDHAMKDRRELVLRQLELVEKAQQGGRPAQAASIQSKLVDDYAKYTDLADLFTPAANAPSPSPPAAEVPPAAPAASNAPETKSPTPAPAPSPVDPPVSKPATPPDTPKT